MKKLVLTALAGILLQGCVIQAVPPMVTANVIDADREKGNQFSLKAERCGMAATCTEMLLNKAQEVCPMGYIIQQRMISNDIYYGGPIPSSMLIRCAPYMSGSGGYSNKSSENIIINNNHSTGK